MIKVDHAGENGAVNIYRAQRVGSQIRTRKLIPKLTEFQRHEEEHRRLFNRYLATNDIRRCVSYHICGVGGYTLGLVTGLIGPSAVAATTFAVEKVVLEHLEEQIAYLAETDRLAFECVLGIFEDEMAHHDEARNQLNHDALITVALVFIVGACTEMVIRFGMR